MKLRIITRVLVILNTLDGSAVLQMSLLRSDSSLGVSNRRKYLATIKYI